MRRKQGMVLYCTVMLVLIGICIGVGRVTAESYIDNVKLEDYLKREDITIAYYDMGFDEVTNRGYLDNDEIKELDDLMEQDTVIVKAKINDNVKRELYYECILSQVQIIEVYQGSIEGDEYINIFEPVDCGFKDQILCADGYSMMQSGEEYILFLKTLQNTYYGDDKYVYAPSSTRYSKYAVNDKVPTLFRYEELEELNSMHYYNEIKDQEIYLHEQDDYEKYLTLKQQVLDTFS